MRTSIVRLAAAALLATTLSAVTATTVGATPKTPTTPSAPTLVSSGVNNWFCRPSAAHPRPVVMLHGLGGNGPGNFAFLALAVASQGYCVFDDLTYGAPVPLIPVGGLKPIKTSAKEIISYLDRVRQATGASKVDIVGHSEGGFQSLYIPKVMGYGSRVGTVVALAPPSHGTTFSSLVTLADFLGLRASVDFLLATFGCQACPDLLPGGGAVNELTNGPIAVPGVNYTIIASRADVLVTPMETSFVREPGVDNEVVQDSCPFDPVGHIGLAFEQGVADLVTNALDPATARSVRCSVGLPF